MSTAAPGDPILIRTFDPNITDETREIMRRQLGLDQPLPMQYMTWFSGLMVRRGDVVAQFTSPTTTCGYVGGIDMTVCNTGGGIIRGNLGTSLQTRQPVWDRLVERMPATLELGIAALLVVVGDRRPAGRDQRGLSGLVVRRHQSLLRRDLSGRALPSGWG